MKTTFAFVFLGLCAFALSEQTLVNLNGKPYRVADKTFLERQRNILNLFKNILQTNVNREQTEIAQNYNIEQNVNRYGNQQVVRELVTYYQQGMLPRGEVFSIFNEVQRQQAIALTQVLYSAKDWETFYKTACWARENVNEGIFVYAMHVAVLHREDTQGIVLPAIYEIYPYYFVNSEVIAKAYEIKMKHGGKQQQQQNNIYYIPANYSGRYVNTNPEQSDMSYYNEDVGLNAYYYYYNIDYPSWLGGQEYGLNQDRRGELYYYYHQQLIARYYLERLSNGYGSIPVYNWEEPIKTGYVPTMRYSNGLQFPARPANSKVVYNPYNQAYSVNGEDNVIKIQQIQDYERRIRDAIDSGYVITEDGTKVNIYEKNGLDILGRIVDSNPDSPNQRYYGYLLVIARQILGYSNIPVNDYQINPSVLEQYETSLRDPMFYQLYKRIINYFLQYKSNLPNYTSQQLQMQGVKIQEVSVDKLVTYMDTYDFDITNAVYLNEQELQQENGIQIRVRQERLNHKPYSYKINVESDKVSDVVVRVFLGPKYDEQGREIPLNQNRVNFVELDKFVTKLQQGQNIIERNSRQGKTVRDRTTIRALYQQVMSALQGQQEFHLDMSEAHNGYPNRLVLPRGTESGQVYQLYVHIGQHKQHQQNINYDNVISAGVGRGGRYVDNLPLGYPLDRQIENEQVFMVPNSYIKDVVIHHRNQNELNASRQ